MQVEIITRPGIPLVGKLGCGPAACAQQWIPPLWQSANANFQQVRPMVLWNGQGGIRGLWGAMSDVQSRFLPWGESGMYLAGFEVKPEATAPEDWVRWDVPAFRYATITTTQMEQREAYAYMREHYLPDQGFSLVGAVQEHYPEEGNIELLQLCFPIERL